MRVAHWFKCSSLLAAIAVLVCTAPAAVWAAAEGAASTAVAAGVSAPVSTSALALPSISLSAGDWLALLLNFLTLSLLAVGGAIGTAPEMHRFLVERQGWLTDPQFSASIAIAQAAPGPNVLFVALMGWSVGVNAGGAGLPGWLLGSLGLLLSMAGILLPSSLLTWAATRWAERNQALRTVRALKQGLAPVVVGLVLATAWLLGRAHGDAARDWPLWLLSVATALIVWRTRLHLLWLLGAGAVAGALGWV